MPPRCARLRYASGSTRAAFSDEQWRPFLWRNEQRRPFLWRDEDICADPHEFRLLIAD